MSVTGFINANLSNADLSETELIKTGLYRTDLSRTNLYLADFEAAFLREAILREATLREANLNRAILRGADLRGADLRGADLKDIKFDEYTVFQAVIGLDEALNVPPEILFQYVYTFSKETSEIELEKIKKDLGILKDRKHPKDEAKIKVLEAEINKIEIEKAINLFNKPNEYIKDEITVAKRLFYSCLFIVFASALLFVIAFVCNLQAKNENLNDGNIYSFLTGISSLVLAFSLAITFFRFANKKREEIKILNEQKRKIETIKASLLAFNIVAPPHEVRPKIIAAITQLQEDAFKIQGITASTKSTTAKDESTYLEQPIETLQKIKSLVK